jgi:hypothetical protein
MNEPISESSFRVSLQSDEGLNGSLPLAANDAPSITAPGTAVIGSGANIRAIPALRRVFEMELGFATCLSPSRVPASARHPATKARSFSTRVAELALDLRSRARRWLSLTTMAGRYPSLTGRGSKGVGHGLKERHNSR